MLKTEPIGSVPRPQYLIDAAAAFQKGGVQKDELDALYTQALRETIALFEATGSPVIADGEQTKPSFVGYPLFGATNLAADGVIIPFADGHTRQLPKLTSGRFRYGVYADGYLEAAKKLTNLPVKQAVIACSAMSLLYPAEGIADYAQEEFIGDLLNEAEKDIRRSLEKGAYNVQIDFTEGRLSCKLDPSKNLLKQFIALNNQVLERFTETERQKIGVHTCPGGDRDSTHSADVDYAELLPDLFEMKVGNFYVQMASEQNRPRVLEIIKGVLKPHQTVFIGVIDPISERIETPEDVKDRILEAAEYIPLNQLGTTDDCGFSPFGDDVSTARETAFEKIRARVEGTKLASAVLKVA